MPEYSTNAPGTSQRMERAFENAPPMIPHSTEGLIPITKDKHMCISCHMPEIAVVMKSTPIPPSHMTDYRPDVNVNSDGKITKPNVVQKDLGGKLDMSRYMCTQCHVPQADISPAIQNNFEAAYRKREARNQSNLSENISEGVK
jgi:cytochrome c-type protein NapB